MKSKSDSSHKAGSSSFLFTVCQVGAEATLKKEIAREHPSLKFAYSKPGFLTFKQAESPIPQDFDLHSVFARSFGVSVGGVKSSEFSKLSEIAQDLLKAGKKSKLRLHVWERDLHPPGEEPKGFQSGAWARKWEKNIRKQMPGLFEDFPQAKTDDLVMDVILLDEDLAWVGSHIHSATHSPWPGGRPLLSVPKEAPSRAYLKLEEAILWSGTHLRSGDTAVEIGSAPGGASYALLERGLHVVGIDPAKMDPLLLKHPHFQHFQTPVANILREDLPDSVEWLLLDMNVEPEDLTLRSGSAGIADEIVSPGNLSDDQIESMENR